MSVPDHLSQGLFLLQSSVMKTKSQSASLFTGSVRNLLRNLLTATSRSIWILSSLVAFVLWSVFGKVKISLHDTNPTELVSLMALLLTLPITRTNQGACTSPVLSFTSFPQSDFDWNRFCFLHAVPSARPLQCFVSLMRSSLPPPSPLSLPFWIMHMLWDQCSSRDSYSVVLPVHTCPA